jgi:hypothetical protein
LYPTAKSIAYEIPRQSNCICAADESYANKEDRVLILNNEQDGINHLILGVAPPILIMEKFLFSFKEDNMAMFKDLLKKNRDTLHGGFALNEEGNKVIYRYTMQLETLDYNEFEGAINALGLLLSEFAENIIEYSKY